MKNRFYTETVLGISASVISTAAFIFFPQFSAGQKNVSIFNLIKEGAEHNFILYASVLLCAVMSIIAVMLFLRNKRREVGFLLPALPTAEMIMIFSVIFGLVALKNGESLFFGPFTALTALTVFLAPLIPLYKMKLKSEE